MLALLIAGLVGARALSRRQRPLNQVQARPYPVRAPSVPKLRPRATPGIANDDILYVVRGNGDPPVSGESTEGARNANTGERMFYGGKVWVSGIMK